MENNLYKAIYDNRYSTTFTNHIVAESYSKAEEKLIASKDYDIKIKSLELIEEDIVI